MKLINLILSHFKFTCSNYKYSSNLCLGLCNSSFSAA